MKYLEARYPDGRLHGTTCATPEFEARYRLNMAAMGLTVTAYTLEECRQKMEAGRAAKQQAEAVPERRVDVYPRSRALHHALLRMRVLERDRARRPLPKQAGLINDDQLEQRLTWDWHRRTEHFAAYVAARRGMAEQLLFPHRSTAYEQAYWANRIQEQHAQHVQKQAEIEANWQHELRRCPTPSAFALAGMPWIGAEMVHPLIGPCRVTHMLFFVDGAPGVPSPYYHDDYWRPVAVGPRGSSLVRPGEWRPAADVMSSEAPKHRYEPPEAAPSPVTENHPPAEASPKPSRMPSLF